MNSGGSSQGQDVMFTFCRVFGGEMSIQLAHVTFSASSAFIRPRALFVANDDVRKMDKKMMINVRAKKACMETISPCLL